MGRRTFVLAMVPALSLAAAAAARAAKPEPPLSVALRVVAADAARGRYRIEVRLRADLTLEEPFLRVKVQPSAGAPALQTASRRDSVEPVALIRGREARREVEVLTLPHEPVTVMVGLGGMLGAHHLHRTASLDLGEPVEPAPSGRVRTDQHGQTYLEVPMRPSERQR